MPIRWPSDPRGQKPPEPSQDSQVLALIRVQRKKSQDVRTRQECTSGCPCTERLRPGCRFSLRTDISGVGYSETNADPPGKSALMSAVATRTR